MQTEKLSCKYCGKTGHEESNYCELIGYPPGWGNRRVEEVTTDHVVDGRRPKRCRQGAVVDEKQRTLPRQPMVHSSATRKVHKHQPEQPVLLPNRYSDF